VTEERWRRLEEIFQATLDLDDGQQTAFIERECAGDQRLHDDVMALLAHDRAAGRALDAVVKDATVSLHNTNLDGLRLGPYRVLREVAHGGMGTVYLAERADGQYHKRVAIKLIRYPGGDAGVIARFRTERQILARLDHPYIARLLDGGVSADGLPYLVMEYVEGQPIHTYCRERRLSIEDQCDLFSQVCEAVSYAHRNLVVHRDLKPSNILVTSDGSPKLLDFGVAKLLAEDPGENALTLPVARHLTPDYASPEQVRGEPANTATDVYSLGAVLYELLTGVRPHRFVTYTPDEIVRCICDTEVPRPSTAFPDGVEDPTPRKGLAGDLDNIVLKAMRKEPARRYDSVDQLRQDLDRYVRGLPVSARPDRLLYRASKFVRRNRWGVALAATAVLCLAAAMVATVSSAEEARRQRGAAEAGRQAALAAQRHAEQRRQEADEARRFAELEHLDAERQRDAALHSLDEARRSRAAADESLRNLAEMANFSLVEVHDRIARLPQAKDTQIEIVKATVDLLDKMAPQARSDPRFASVLAESYTKLGDVTGYPLVRNLGDPAGAQAYYRKGLGVLEAALAAHPANLDLHADRAALLGRRAHLCYEAHDQDGFTTAYQQADSDAEMVLAGGTASRHALLNAGAYYEDAALVAGRGVSDDAARYARLSMAIYTRLEANYPGDERVHRGMSAVLGILAHVAERQQYDSKGAVAYARRAVALREELAAAHPDDIAVLRNLVLGYARLGDYLGSVVFATSLGDTAGALEQYRKCLAICERLQNADPRDLLARRDLATAKLRAAIVLERPDQRAESLSLLEQSRRAFEEILAATPQNRAVISDLLLTFEYLARRFRESGDFDQAWTWVQRAMARAGDLVQRNPKDVVAQAQILANYQVLTLLEVDRGNRDGAIRDGEKMVRIADEYAAAAPHSAGLRARSARTRLWFAAVYRALGRSGLARAGDEQLSCALYGDGLNRVRGARLPAPPSELAEADQRLAACAATTQ
jgi:eukaryotic-like serine/threonine-protein kinase